jgi:4-amino-4-deoxy-L-arabinose transferase-like glycosyltransferase
MGTCLYTFALSRVVMLDAPVSFFMVATLSGFLYAANAPSGRKRTLVIYAMYLAAAGAVLTKGLIGAVLPGAIVFLWMAGTRRWSLLKNMRLLGGSMLFLIIAAPWHMLVAMRNPEWSWFYFVHEHWLRYFTPEAGRNKPVWFFAAVLLAGLFPWTVFLYQAKMETLKGFWKRRLEDGTPLFLSLWIAFIFVFYSLSHSKLIPYILPIFPPLAAMIGRYFAAAWQEKPVRGWDAGFWGLIALLIAMTAAPSIVLSTMDADNKVAVAMRQGGDELHYLSFAAMISAGLLLLVYIQGLKRHVITAMFFVAVVILQFGDAVGAHYNKDSMENFAKFILAVHHPEDEVAMYQVYYQDMPVYLERRIIVADWKGELEYGMEHEDASAWMMSASAFWEHWLKNDHRMLVVMRDDAFARLTKDKTTESLHLYLIRTDGRNLLFLNRNPDGPAPHKAPSTLKKTGTKS